MAKIFLIYLCAGLITFANGLSGPFMLDDHAFFTPEIKDIRYLPGHFMPKTYKSQQVQNVPHGQPNFYYRPFAKVLPSISYAMFGEKTFFYHVLNLILLVGAGFLLFRFLLGTGVLGHRGAFLAGLLYIVHPINGVMVNYITASVFTVQVIFMLGALFCLMLGYEGRGTREEGRENKEKTESESLAFLQIWKFKSASSSAFGLQPGVLFFSSPVLRPASFGLLCFIFALLCHETAVLLPLYAAIMFYVKAPTGPFLNRIFFCINRTWFLWAAAAGWMVFRFFYASLGDGLIAKFTRFEMNPVEHTASVGKLIGWYLSKLIVPWDIVLIWATPVVRGTEVFFWLSVFVISAVGLFYGFRRTKDKAFRIGLLWLMAGFLPLPLMCLFQPTHGPMIEPHWFVFSSIGFFIGLARCGEMTTATPGVAVVLVLCFLVAGWRHNSLWADEKRYAHYWSQEAPSIKAVWFHLGEIYFKERRFSEAVRYYERSVRRTYQDYLAYQRMGLAYFQAGDFPRAYMNFMFSLDIEPRQPGIRERLKWIEDRRAIE